MRSEQIPHICSPINEDYAARLSIQDQMPSLVQQAKEIYFNVINEITHMLDLLRNSQKHAQPYAKVKLHRLSNSKGCFDVFIIIRLHHFL